MFSEHYCPVWYKISQNVTTALHVTEALQARIISYLYLTVSKVSNEQIYRNRADKTKQVLTFDSGTQATEFS